MARKPEMSASSIVCLGAFNPPILTPDWLERHNLIGGDDADDARQASNFLVSPQVTQFETRWFAVQVIEHQFSLTSKGALTEAFKDLAVGILTLLPQTPISALGLNYTSHYKLASQDEYHAIGDVLAPKPIWRKLFPDEHLNIGMANLTVQVQEMNRETSVVTSKDRKNITVQPSGIIKNAGVFLAFNDHREIGQTNKLPAERAAEIIDSEWESTTQEAMRVFDGVIDAVLETAAI